VIDRFYFRSVYFREPGGILYEIASVGPGFTSDEPLESAQGACRGREHDSLAVPRAPRTNDHAPPRRGGGVLPD
jgi:hypothetical protein